MAICFHTGVALEASEIKVGWFSKRITRARKVVSIIRNCFRKELYPSPSTKNGKTSVQNPLVFGLGWLTLYSCIL